METYVIFGEEIPKFLKELFSLQHDTELVVIGQLDLKYYRTLDYLPNEVYYMRSNSIITEQLNYDLSKDTLIIFSNLTQEEVFNKLDILTLNYTIIRTDSTIVASYDTEYFTEIYLNSVSPQRLLNSKTLVSKFEDIGVPLKLMASNQEELLIKFTNESILPEEFKKYKEGVRYKFSLEDTKNIERIERRFLRGNAFNIEEVIIKSKKVNDVININSNTTNAIIIENYNVINDLLQKVVKKELLVLYFTNEAVGQLLKDKGLAEISKRWLMYEI